MTLAAVAAGIDDNTGLDTPLLPSHYSHSMPVQETSFDWPSQAAENVGLVVPPGWAATSPNCVLRFDAAQRLLRVVASDESGTVLDAFDPDDIVGVDLQLQLSGLNTERATASPNDSSNNSNNRDSNEPATDTLQDTQGAAVLTIYSYPRKDSSQTTWMNWCGVTSFTPKPNPHYERAVDESTTKLGLRYAHHRRFTVAPAEDLGDCNTLLTALRKLANTNGNNNVKNDVNAGTKRYLILVNPRSGPKRNAAVLCEQHVQPMLEQAGVDVDVCVTTHARHGEERMLAISDSTSTTAAATSGSTEEVLVVERDLSEYDGLVLMGGDGIVHEALNGIMARQDSGDILKKLKIGVVGCGTANGFATSVTYESQETYGLVNEAFLIAKGTSIWTDLSKYQTANKSYTSFLTYSWGIIADIDIESEAIHFLGETRFDLWAVLRVLFLRRYRARFSYLPADKVADKTKAIANMPALTEAIPSDWVTVEDDILLFWASHV